MCRHHAATPDILFGICLLLHKVFIVQKWGDPYWYRPKKVLFHVTEVSYYLEYVLKWWLHDLVLSGWNFDPSSWDRFYLTITWETNFYPGKTWQVSTYLINKKPIDSHSFKNIHKMMKFYRDNCLLLFTSHSS